MLKLLRYTLAAIFLAASVGCLGLWCDCTNFRKVQLPTFIPGFDLSAGAVGGVGSLYARNGSVRWKYTSLPLGAKSIDALREPLKGRRFGTEGGKVRWVFFPLWYPGLVFALAAVGVLRLGKPFTVRLALIATAVVAGLLGMVVAL